MLMVVALFVVLAGQVLYATAHITAWHPGLYAFNGTNPGDLADGNQQDTSHPLYQMDTADWWMHGPTIMSFPPPDGTFLELPAGGQFTVEMAQDKGQTSYSFGGQDETLMADGLATSTIDMFCAGGCGMLHATSLADVAGSAFAISYVSDINAVTPENLVVFSVNVQTPWARIANFQVPQDLPACPEGGCICAWGWVPNGNGQPNMYMLPYKCTVTGATSTVALGTAQPPTCCYDDPMGSGCVSGPKQMIFWNQNTGNNIDFQQSLNPPQSPGYNPNCGYADGAQNDIFASGGGGGPAANAEGGASTSSVGATSTSSMSASVSTSTTQFTSFSDAPTPSVTADAATPTDAPSSSVTTDAASSSSDPSPSFTADAAVSSNASDPSSTTSSAISTAAPSTSTSTAGAATTAPVPEEVTTIIVTTTVTVFEGPSTTTTVSPTAAALDDVADDTDTDSVTSTSTTDSPTSSASSTSSVFPNMAAPTGKHAHNKTCRPSGQRLSHTRSRTRQRRRWFS